MEEYFEIGKKYLKHKKEESEKMQAKLCICKAANVKPHKSTYKKRRQMQKVADDNEEGGCPATLHYTYPFNMEVSAIILCEGEGGLQK